MCSLFDLDITGQVGNLKVVVMNAGVTLGLRYLQKISINSRDYLYMSAESTHFSGIVYRPDDHTILAIIDESIKDIK